MRQIVPPSNTSAIIRVSIITPNNRGGGRHEEITTKGKPSDYMGNWLVSAHHHYLNDYLRYIMIHEYVIYREISNFYPLPSRRKSFVERYSLKEAFVWKPELIQ